MSYQVPVLVPGIVAPIIYSFSFYSCTRVPVRHASSFHSHQSMFSLATDPSIDFAIMTTDSAGITERIAEIADATVQRLQDIVGTDAGRRGMKALIVPGDLVHASRILASLIPHQHDDDDDDDNDYNDDKDKSSLVLILTGFPCCVEESPPTETDGPPGALALARTAVQLGHHVKICTDDSNALVLQAAMDGVGDWAEHKTLQLEVFSSTKDEDDRMRVLARKSCLVIACERAGPSADGLCYTMRGINMNSYNVIAPLDRLVEYSDCPFVAIGDGGNELGMGKVMDQVKAHIPSGDKVGCVIAADYLVAASVSNWGAYAVAAGASVMRAQQEAISEDDFRQKVKLWISKCLPSEQEEVDLLDRCVAKGCRDGVSGKVEATVDGMPLATSLQCLQELRDAALNL